MRQQQSLATAAARNLATTTKSVPQMQGISSRWLLRLLPWVQVAGGVYRSVDVNGHLVPSWRGVPIFPCNKIPVSGARTSSILLLRTGEEHRGVVGLHQTGIPDEYQPSLSVRFMGISEKAIISCLVSAYYSAAGLVPDALAMLENCEIGREG